MRMGKYAYAPAQGAQGGSKARGKKKPKLRVKVRPRRVRARTRGTRVRITVTAKRKGKRVRVRGARIHLAGRHARTNRRGRAVIRKRLGFMRVRRYTVTAQRKGYRFGTARVRAVR